MSDESQRSGSAQQGKPCAHRTNVWECPICSYSGDPPQRTSAAQEEDCGLSICMTCNRATDNKSNDTVDRASALATVKAVRDMVGQGYLALAIDTIDEAIVMWSSPCARPAVPGASAADCHICNAPTLMRVVVGDGFAPICSAKCELAFANRRSAEALMCILCGTRHSPGHRECLSGDGGSASPFAASLKASEAPKCQHPGTRLQHFDHDEGDRIAAWCECCGAFRLAGYAQWHEPKRRERAKGDSCRTTKSSEPSSSSLSSGSSSPDASSPSVAPNGHPWAGVVAAAVRFVDSGKAEPDLIGAVRMMQDKAYGIDHSMCGTNYCYFAGCHPGVAATPNASQAVKLEAELRSFERVPEDVHESGWQWRPVSDDTAFAPPFGTIRMCIACGCLVAGGPTRCSRCAALCTDAETAADRPSKAPTDAQGRVSAAEASRRGWCVLCGTPEPQPGRRHVPVGGIGIAFACEAITEVDAPPIKQDPTTGAAIASTHVFDLTAADSSRKADPFEVLISMTDAEYVVYQRAQRLAFEQAAKVAEAVPVADRNPALVRNEIADKIRALAALGSGQSGGGT